MGTEIRQLFFVGTNISSELVDVFCSYLAQQTDTKVDWFSYCGRYAMYTDGLNKDAEKCRQLLYAIKEIREDQSKGSFYHEDGDPLYKYRPGVCGSCGDEGFEEVLNHEPKNGKGITLMIPCRRCDGKPVSATI